MAGGPALDDVRKMGHIFRTIGSERLLHIAKHWPVARLLEEEIVIDTVLDGDAR